MDREHLWPIDTCANMETKRSIWCYIPFTRIQLGSTLRTTRHALTAEAQESTAAQGGRCLVKTPAAIALTTHSSVPHSQTVFKKYLPLKNHVRTE